MVKDDDGLRNYLGLGYHRSGNVRCLLIADNNNWAFANRAQALKRNAPSDITIDIAYGCSQPLPTICWPRYDVVFLLNTMKLDEVRATLDTARAKCKLIVSHNSGIGRRTGMMIQATIGADYVIVNNYATYAMIRGNARPSLNVCNISNGVDLTTFKVTTPIGKRPHKVLWTASESKALLESRDPNEDDVKRYRAVIQPMEKILSSVPGWEHDFMVIPKQGQPLSGKAMCEWYNSGSYLLCPSKSEGTPNIILEAAACGCIPISLPIGNVPEAFADGESCALSRGPQIYQFFEALQAAREKREHLSDRAADAMRDWDWKVRAPYFYSLFRAIGSGHSPAPFSYRDGEPEDVLPGFAEPPEDVVLAPSLNGRHRLGV